MRSLGAKILEVSGLAKFSEPELISPKEYDSSNAMSCPICHHRDFEFRFWQREWENGKTVEDSDTHGSMTCPYCGNQVKNAMNLENDKKPRQELVDLLIEDWNKRAEKSPHVSELIPK